MAAKYSARSPLQDRHHALVAVDAMIIEAVRVQDGYATRPERLRSGSDHRIEVLLRRRDAGSDRPQSGPASRPPRS